MSIKLFDYLMTERVNHPLFLFIQSAEFDVVESSSHVACPHCRLRYCSASCRDEAWRLHHHLLCLGPGVDDEMHPSNVLDELWKNSHFPPETASIHLITRILAMVNGDVRRLYGRRKEILSVDLV